MIIEPLLATSIQWTQRRDARVDLAHERVVSATHLRNGRRTKDCELHRSLGIYRLPNPDFTQQACLSAVYSRRTAELIDSISQLIR